MRPLGDRVKIELEPEFKGEIIAPQDTKSPKVASVLGVGEKVGNVKEGDRVLVKRFKPISHKGEEYLFTKENNILAKYE